MTITDFDDNNVTRWDLSVKGREISRSPDGHLVFPAVFAQIIPHLMVRDISTLENYAPQLNLAHQ